MQQALAALHFFRRDVQYIVADGKVQIVDEYTGRVMPDRSWERGMHQLIEAKEGCAVTERRKTLARITYQRFFRRYLHLCGMTGTALEPAGELSRSLRPAGRAHSDEPAVAADECRHAACCRRPNANGTPSSQSAHAVARAGRAVLIGTRSVEASEHVAKLMGRGWAASRSSSMRGRIARRPRSWRGAGEPGRVTVATNMAGRGTDIQLHPAVRAAGGLHVILTEYHRVSSDRPPALRARRAPGRPGQLQVDRGTR